LVVVRKGDSFVSVLEREGWYLPAGRVDYGESFRTGAVRETLEEAGIPVNLTGILRVEHSGSRLRIIFAAAPSDDTPLKSVADEETYKAEWVTVNELAAKKLRNPEVLKIFTWAFQEAPLYPISLLEGYDGNEIDNKNVVTYLVHSSKVVIQKENTFLAVKDGDKFVLLERYMDDKMLSHTENANLLLQKLQIDYQLKGIVKISHSPPTTRAIPHGLFCITFLATGDSTIEVGEDLTWCTPDVFTHQSESTLLAQILSGEAVVCDLKILTREGDKYSN